MGPTGRASPLLQDAGLNGREPPEKEKGRRRLKESFENYRRWARVGGGWGCGRGPHASPRPPALSVSRRKRALRKMQLGARQGEADGENTTGSDNTDTEGA